MSGAPVCVILDRNNHDSCYVKECASRKKKTPAKKKNPPGHFSKEWTEEARSFKSHLAQSEEVYAI